MDTWTNDTMQARRNVFTDPTEKARVQAAVIKIQDLKLERTKKSSA
jgi:hypothetical protein